MSSIVRGSNDTEDFKISNALLALSKIANDHGCTNYNYRARIPRTPT